MLLRCFRAAFSRPSSECRAVPKIDGSTPIQRHMNKRTMSYDNAWKYSASASAWSFAAVDLIFYLPYGNVCRRLLEEPMEIDSRARRVIGDQSSER